MIKYAVRPKIVNELPDLVVSYDALVALFAKGKVPREQDYLKLLEYINYLHILLGIEGRGEPALGAGLNASGGKLNVDTPSVGNGLNVKDGVVSAIGSESIRVVGKSISLVSEAVSESMIFREYGATFMAVDSDKRFIYLLSSLNGLVYARGWVRKGSYVAVDTPMSEWKCEGVIPVYHYADLDNVYLCYRDVELQVGMSIRANTSFQGGGAGFSTVVEEIVE